MIRLYTWKTPNGRKISIALEELGLSYDVHPVDITADQQFDPAYLAINPNNKIPALIVEEGAGRQVIFESGAILLYLADREGRLIAPDGQPRQAALAWLFWASSGLAPMLGQWAYYVRRAKTPMPEAVERFTKEVRRLFGVLEGRLGEAPFLAGDYSVADIAAFTWAHTMLPIIRGTAPDALGPTPNIDRWLKEIGARPAVQRGLAIP